LKRYRGETAAFRKIVRRIREARPYGYAGMDDRHRA